MDGTEGFVRDLNVVDTESPIQTPVGHGTLGHILNVIGESIDEHDLFKGVARKPIHADAPTNQQLPRFLRLVLKS